MSRKTWIFAIASGGVSLLLVSPIIIWVSDDTPRIQSVAPKAPSPVAFVLDRDIDVGVVEPGKTLQDCLIIHSLGDVPLQILTGKSGCRAPQPVKKRATILPGKHTGIDVNINSNLDPGNYTHGFIIHTDDPDNPKLQIWLTYTVTDLKVSK